MCYFSWKKQTNKQTNKQKNTIPMFSALFDKVKQNGKNITHNFCSAAQLINCSEALKHFQRNL